MKDLKINASFHYHLLHNHTTLSHSNKGLPTLLKRRLRWHIDGPPALPHHHHILAAHIWISAKKNLSKKKQKKFPHPKNRHHSLLAMLHVTMQTPLIAIHLVTVATGLVTLGTALLIELFLVFGQLHFAGVFVGAVDLRHIARGTTRSQ